MLPLPVTLLAFACGADDGRDPAEDFDSGSYTKTDAGSKADGLVQILETGPGQTCIGTCAVQIAVGGTHACALLVDGTVRCWGSNLSGQLGVVGPTSASLPAEVPGLGTVKAIAAGGWHTCALTAASKVFCWGSNGDGELAQPSDTTAHPSPIEVSNFPAGATPTDIAAGSFHNCVLLSGDRVACWGYNAQGQTGLGTVSGSTVSPTKVDKPNPVGSLTGAKAIALGGTTTCATKATGIECLGSNIFGQLGLGSESPGVDPVAHKLSGILGGVGSFPTSSGRHFLLALQDGRVQGWGSNAYGESTAGDAGKEVLQPTVYPGLSEVDSVAVGDDTSCAVTRERTVKCWGRNAQGQAGQVGGKDVLTPTVVPGLANIFRAGLSVVAFGCALTYDGQAYCWGSNDSGQLGNGTTTGGPTPVKVKL